MVEYCFVIVRSFDISLRKLISELLGKETAGSLVVVYIALLTWLFFLLTCLMVSYIAGTLCDEPK